MPPPAPRPGRRPDPATHRRWRQRLDCFRTSGLTVADFCERERISTASFYSWRRRLQAGPAPTDDVPGFVPVRLVTPPASAPVELLLPSGIVVRLSPDTDLAWLRQLLPVLGVAPC
jgi:transposase